MSKKSAKPSAATDIPARDRSAADVARTLTDILPPDVKVIRVPKTAKLFVDVDVNEMAVAYTIALDARTIIQSLVDRREDLPNMDVGTHRLSWGFGHMVKGWKHKVTLTVDATKTVLEEKSEANKDPDKSIGVTFLVVS
jgi:hypothetical protein